MNASSPGGRRRRGIHRLGAGLVTFSLLAGGGILAGTAAETVAAVSPAFKAPSASAADQGPGYGSYANNDFIGAFMVGGVPTWCIQPGVGLPKGATADQGIVGSLNGLSATTIAQLHAATAIGAQNLASNPNAWATATAFVVKVLADPNGLDTSEGKPATGGSAQQIMDSAIQWQASVIGADTPTVQQLADQLLAQVQAVTPASGTFQPDVSIAIDAGNNFKGTVTVSNVPAGTSTTLGPLVNGVFVENGQNTITVTDSATVHTNGTPPVNQATYKISGPWSSTNPNVGYTSQIHYYTTAGGQDTVSADQIPTSASTRGRFADPMDRVVPTITTKASAGTSPGARYTDTAVLTGTAAAFGPGVDVWSSAYLVKGSNASAADVCTTPIYTTPKLTVTQAGTYDLGGKDAPILPLSTPSTGWHIDWIEHVAPTGSTTEFATGKCGTAAESTPIVPFTVTTTPPSGLVEPQAGGDTITVNGYAGPNTTVAVNLFKQGAGEPQLVCDAGHQVGTTLPAVAIKEGLNTNAVYSTATPGALAAGNYGYQEQTFFNGTPGPKAGCLEELFTVNKLPVPAGVSLPTVAG